MINEKAKRASLLEVLEQLTPNKVNYPLVQKQIKEYTENYRYTESGLLGTLYYAINVKHLRIDPRKGIAILPYLYNEARKYYDKLNEIENIKKVDVKEEIVYIDPPKTRRQENLIDIESLLEGEE